MSKISDAISEGGRELHGFCTLGPAGFAITAGASPTFKSVTTFAYIADGVFKSRTTQSCPAFVVPQANGAFTNNKPVPANVGGMTVFYVAGVDAAGLFTVYQSQRAFMAEVQEDGTTKYRGYDLFYPAANTPVAVKTAQLEDFNSAYLPDVPNGVTPFGILKQVCTTAYFIPGTDALDKAGTTPTYLDISLIPGGSNL
jgi:hypothetical protein